MPLPPGRPFYGVDGVWGDAPSRVRAGFPSTSIITFGRSESRTRHPEGFIPERARSRRVTDRFKGINLPPFLERTTVGDTSTGLSPLTGNLIPSGNQVEGDRPFPACKPPRINLRFNCVKYRLSRWRHQWLRRLFFVKILKSSVIAHLCRLRPSTVEHRLHGDDRHSKLPADLDNGDVPALCGLV